MPFKVKCPCGDADSSEDNFFKTINTKTRLFFRNVATLYPHFIKTVKITKCNKVTLNVTRFITLNNVRTVLNPSGQLLIMNQRKGYIPMSYVAQQPRKRFNFRLNEAEREQITKIMQREGIPDAAKAIRYCIAEHAAALDETPQGKEGGK